MRSSTTTKSLYVAFVLFFFLLIQHRARSLRFLSSCSAPPTTSAHRRWSPTGRRLHALNRNQQQQRQGVNEEINETIGPEVVTGVVAPLCYKGPYPCLSLKFPHLEGSPVWDFVVDTGANVNTIHAILAQTYNLTPVQGLPPMPLPAAGMGGSFAPGSLVVVPNAVLANMPSEQGDITFIHNLTVAALPRASPPPTAGLLGSSLCAMFPSGVEFDWFGTDGDPPTFCFYFNEEGRSATTTTGMTRIPIQQIMGLFVVTITVNGKDIPALLDTGSPITVLTKDAARQASLEVAKEDADDDTPSSAPQLGNHHHVKVGGIDGRPMEVMRSASTNVHVQVGTVSLGQGPVYIGSVPAFSILQQAMPDISDTTTPSAILGLDFLRRAYRMIIVANRHEMWLDKLDGTKALHENFRRMV